MNLKTSRKKKICNITFILVILILNIVMISNFNKYNSIQIQDSPINSKDVENQKNPRTSAQTYSDIPWLKNTDFSSLTIEPWFNETIGDSTDIEPSNSTGQADFLVIGDNGTIEISNLFVDPTKWVAFNKSASDNIPNNGYDVGYDGVNCSHNWNDGTANQKPVVYWRYNVSNIGFDMTDYEITSASIEAVMNASVNRNVDVAGDVYATYDDEPPGVNRSLNQFPPYDYIHYTVEISDMDVSPDNTYMIAENKTKNLGKWDYGIELLDLEKVIEPKNETDINFFLSRVFEADIDGHDNFTIILGISPHSFDNHWNLFDFDNFEIMRIKDVNLTFDYKKKININTALSWSQMGNAINYTSPLAAQVKSAVVNFEYKIDRNWTIATESMAENSEFRILINKNPSEDYPTIKLNRANETFQEAITGSYDVTNLIPLKENITLSIQVYIADDFKLDQTINISIDNILFNISYSVFTVTGGGAAAIAGDGSSGKDVVKEEPWTNLLIAIAAIAGAIGLGSYLVAYQLYLKYPKPVRKVRKYRRTLKRKGSPGVEITSRDKLFNDKYKKHSNIVSNLPKGKVSGKSSPSPKTIGKVEKKPST